jgi:arabinose-5-phosphate isomerase
LYFYVMDNATPLGTMSTKTVLERSLQAHRKALECISDIPPARLLEVATMLSTSPCVVCTGIGKSGMVARKMAATLSSMNIPAVWIHPTDALHGDSGLLAVASTVVAFSKSGETRELLEFVRSLPQHLPVVAITNSLANSLQQKSTLHVGIHTIDEIDNHNVVPTTSTTSAGIVADIVAVWAAELRGWTRNNLVSTHPAGTIGLMVLTVRDRMIPADTITTLHKHATVVDAVRLLTEQPHGVVCICDQQQLIGIMTDGDVRRLVLTSPNIYEERVELVMNNNPTTIDQHAGLVDALNLMESKTRQISVLPVVTDGMFIGVLRLHDVVGRPK